VRSHAEACPVGSNADHYGGHFGGQNAACGGRSGLDGVLEQGKRGAGLRICLAEGERAALFHGAQRGEVAEAGEQALAGVVAGEGLAGIWGRAAWRAWPPARVRSRA
jgi:hypothetical protein